MTKTTSFIPLSGGCWCGQARFRLETAPIITHACHCRQCQQTSGSGFQTFAMIESDRLTLVEGKTQFFEYIRNHKRLQCPDCGCALWIHRSDLGDSIAFVGVGILDHGELLPPEAHYFVRSKHPWIILPANIPAFDELGDPGKPSARERIMAALAAPAPLARSSTREPPVAG